MNNANAIGKIPFAQAIIALVFVGAFLAFTILNTSAGDYVAKAQQNLGENYNAAAAIENYQKALEVDSTNKQALYDLSRIYYISGDVEKSLETVATYKELYPQEKRIHYVAGLANAYGGNLDIAESEFLTFIESGLSTWAGYLDLAWVYFQNGEFEKAETQLKTAVEEFGDNVWLNTSLGAVSIAIGDTQNAQEYLEVAQNQAENLTVDEWRRSYSFNDASKIDEEIEEMKSVIALNLALSKGETDVVTVAGVLGAGFVGVSPGGYSHGVAVSACADSYSQGSYYSQATYYSQSTYCVANQGDTCFVTNSCGNSSSGTIGCDGTCSASPAGQCDPFAASISAGQCIAGELYVINITAIDPEGDNIRYGIDWNNDGTIDQYVPDGAYTTSGTTQSVGNTFSTTGVKTIRVITEDEGGSAAPAVSHTFVCDEQDQSALLGGGEGSEGGGDGAADGALVAQPLLVKSGSSTTLIWATEGVDSCDVIGTNGDSFSGTSGTQSSGAITAATTFSLNCDDGAVIDSVLVNVVPVFQEI